MRSFVKIRSEQERVDWMSRGGCLRLEGRSGFMTDETLPQMQKCVALRRSREVGGTLIGVGDGWSVGFESPGMGGSRGAGLKAFAAR
jgi:hypothetical protein